MKKKASAKTQKHPGGRPTLYKPSYCKDIIAYFSRPTVKALGDKVIPNDLPFFEDFAAQCSVSYETLTRWVGKYPEFCNAYKRAKELQKSFLIQNGLAGLYNSTFAIFTAKNITDMRDQTQQQVEITGQVGCIIIPQGGRYAREQKAIEAGKKDSLGAAT